MTTQRAYLPRVKPDKCPSCKKRGIGKVTCFDNVYSRSCKYCQYQENMSSSEMTEKIKIIKSFK